MTTAPTATSFHRRFTRCPVRPVLIGRLSSNQGSYSRNAAIHLATSATQIALLSSDNDHMTEPSPIGTIACSAFAVLDTQRDEPSVRMIVFRSFQRGALLGLFTIWVALFCGFSHSLSVAPTIRPDLVMKSEGLRMERVVFVCSFDRDSLRPNRMGFHLPVLRITIL